MEKKRVVLLVAIIVVGSGLVGAISYQQISNLSNTTVTYQLNPITASDYNYFYPSGQTADIHYVGWTTVLSGTVNFTLNSDVNINNFYPTSNGHRLVVIGNEIEPDQAMEFLTPNSTAYMFAYMVEGNVTNFQLAYSGTPGVRLVNG